MEETCPKHDDCLGRIHTEINTMNQTNSKMSGEVAAFMTNLKDFMTKVDKDVYNPKDGLGACVNSHNTQIGLQWGLLATLILGIIVLFLKK